ncbi:MAG: hypothetical protein Q4F84_02330, partial [Fibrobacter sp.]|nr:hypothetical protein [Fibrobacter sp.]
MKNETNTVQTYDIQGNNEPMHVALAPRNAKNNQYAVNIQKRKIRPAEFIIERLLQVTAFFSLISII